jgi:hypothetical protein
MAALASGALHPHDTGVHDEKWLKEPIGAQSEALEDGTPQESNAPRDKFTAL